MNVVQRIQALPTRTKVVIVVVGVGGGVILVRRRAAAAAAAAEDATPAPDPALDPTDPQFGGAIPPLGYAGGPAYLPSAGGGQGQAAGVDQQTDVRDPGLTTAEAIALYQDSFQSGLSTGQGAGQAGGQVGGPPDLSGLDASIAALGAQVEGQRADGQAQTDRLAQAFEDSQRRPPDVAPSARPGAPKPVAKPKPKPKPGAHKPVAKPKPKPRAPIARKPAHKPKPKVGAAVGVAARQAAHRPAAHRPVAARPAPRPAPKPAAKRRRP